MQEQNKKLQNTLNADIWNTIYSKNITINPKVRLKLLKIAKQFFTSLKLNISINDIIITGSIAGYTWNKNSDIDLHIILDFNKINAETEITKDWLRNRLARWNDSHDILIKSFPVEIYIQDKDEENVANGIYSLFRNSWIKIPKKENIEYDNDEVSKEFQSWIHKIDELEEDLANDNSNKNAEKVYNKLDKLKEDLKARRKLSLTNGGIYSIGNLVFKKLRNSGYLEKLKTLINKSYDDMFIEETKQR